MHLLGNYSGWFKPEWLEHIKNNKGIKKPEWIPGQTGYNNYLKKMEDAGYSPETTYWFKFSNENWPFNEELYPLQVEGVEFKTGENCEWWILKYMPGNMMPFHIDMTSNYENPIYLYMTIEDYKPGHVMIYNDRLISHYKAGDLFIFRDVNTLHGACNMGYEPRYILRVALYGDLGKAFLEQYKDLIENAVHQ